MKSILFATLSVAALSILAPSARAAEPPQYFLRADGNVEQRVARAEDDIAAMKKEIASLKEQFQFPVAAKPATTAAPKAAPCACGEACPCLAASASATPVASGHWERQRVGLLRSKDVWVSDAPQVSQAVTYTLGEGTTAVSNCPGGVCQPVTRRR